MAYNWYSSAGISAGNKINAAPVTASNAQSNHGTFTRGRSSRCNICGHKSRRSSSWPIGGKASRNCSLSFRNSSLLISSSLTAALLVVPVSSATTAPRETSAASPRPAKFPAPPQSPRTALPLSSLAAPRSATSPAIQQTPAKSLSAPPAAQWHPVFLPQRPPPPAATQDARGAAGPALHWWQSAAAIPQNFRPLGIAHVLDALAKMFPPLNPPRFRYRGQSARSTGTPRPGIAETVPQMRPGPPPRTSS